MPKVDGSYIFEYFLVHSDNHNANANRHKDDGWNMYRSQKVLKTELKFCEDVNLIVIHNIVKKSFDKGVLTGVTKKKYDVHVVVEKQTGTVLGGKCDCRAPNGFCKHAAASLYTIFDYQCSGKEFLPLEKSRTSQSQKWHQPAVQAATCLKFGQLDFSAFNFDKDTQQHKKKEQKDYKAYQSCPQGMNCMSREKILTLASSLKAMGRANHLVNALESNNYEPVRKQRKINAHLPTTSTTPKDQIPSYHPEITTYDSNINLEYTLSEECHQFYEQHVVVDTDKSKQISLGTRGQHSNTAWINHRTIRITASKVHEIATRKKKYMSKITENKLKQKSFSNRYTRWGIQGEKIALAAYKAQKCKEGFDVKSIVDLGLVVNPSFPFLGASLDGFVTVEKDGTNMHGAVEIKTLAKNASLTLGQAAEVEDFFEYKDNKLHINTQHKHYYQVQAQMFIAGLEWCDLFIWTPQDSDYVTIYKDKIMWAAMMPKLADFYFLHLLPALVEKQNTIDDNKH